MFRRKEDALETDEMGNEILADMDDDALDTGYNDNVPQDEQPEEAPAQAAAPSVKPASTPAASLRPQSIPGVPANRNIASSESRGGNLSSAPKASKRVLTVGHDIHMKGEITTCDRLVIEGSVDATLKDVHTVELAQSGSFKGSAEIEDAEISGAFEGDLICNGRLIIYATGKVSGNVSYGEIEIERGGQLTGTVKTSDQIKSEKQGARKAA